MQKKMDFSAKKSPEGLSFSRKRLQTKSIPATIPRPLRTSLSRSGPIFGWFLLYASATGIEYLAIPDDVEDAVDHHFPYSRNR